MTFLDIINKVLIKLRESTVVAPNSSDYSDLIAQLVNDAKREVEDSWKWTALRTTVPITTVQGTSQYALTGAGDRWKFQADEDECAFNTTQTYDVKRRSAAYVKRMTYYDTSENYPLYFYIEGQDSNGDPYVNFWPTPDKAYVINFELVIPQDELSSGSTEITVPWYPVFLGAYTKAVDERGEDGGASADKSLQTYMLALGDAIALDYAKVDEDEWHV